MPAWQEFLSQYGQHSASTQSCYRLWLERFLRYCDEQQLEPLRCHAEQLRHYHQSLLWHTSKKKRLYSVNTVDMALRTVRHFYRWALNTGRIAQDPTADWCLPRPVQPELPTLSKEQVLRLFNLPDLGSELGPRNQLILELLYTLGWGLQHSITFPVTWQPELEPVRSAWERYTVTCRPYLEADPSPILLLTRHGRPFKDVVGLQMMLRAYGQQLDLPFLLCQRVLQRTRRLLVDQETRRRLPFD